ncbi:MAG: hypothetical protein LBD97_01965 [Bifidobacteriaceae bacterium]|jgi:predicted PurR-regulated permease PerM|nr:hypothetical protein [Bifidobacteriaceae bacterium]
MSKFEDMTLAMALRAQDAVGRAQQRLRRFREDESGMEIIAVVIILVIVVLLAVAFRAKIAEFFASLWETITQGGQDVQQQIPG